MPLCTHTHTPIRLLLLFVLATPHLKLLGPNMSCHKGRTAHIAQIQAKKHPGNYRAASSGNATRNKTESAALAIYSHTFEANWNPMKANKASPKSLRLLNLFNKVEFCYMQLAATCILSEMFGLESFLPNAYISHWLRGFLSLDLPRCRG